MRAVASCFVIITPPVVSSQVALTADELTASRRVCERVRAGVILFLPVKGSDGSRTGSYWVAAIDVSMPQFATLCRNPTIDNAVGNRHCQIHPRRLNSLAQRELQRTVSGMLSAC